MSVTPVTGPNGANPITDPQIIELFERVHSIPLSVKGDALNHFCLRDNGTITCRHATSEEITRARDWCAKMWNEHCSTKP